MTPRARSCVGRCAGGLFLAPPRLVAKVVRLEGEKGSGGVHDRLCSQFPAVPADGPPSRALVMEPFGPVVFAQVRGADLQDRLGAASVPELFRPFHTL